jgi:hypothetical protein
MLISPAAEPVVGRLGWTLTGHWHVNDLLGHILELGALVSSNLAGLMRMPRWRSRIVPLVWHPMVVGSAVLMMLFWHAAAANDPNPDLFTVAHHDWLNWYFALLHVLIVYYCGLNAWVAISHLRGDARAKPVALTWLLCIGLGIAAMLAGLIPWLHLAHWDHYGRIGMCASVVIFAYASARSWQRKLDPYRKLIQATGARL